MRKHSGRCKSSGLNSNIILPVLGISSTLPSTTDPLSAIPKQWRSNKTEKTLTFSIESHITIFAKVELSRKRVSLLLEQEILRVNSQGFNLLDYFAFEWMLNYLVGSQKIYYVNGEKLSTTVFVAYIILLDYRKNENLLYDRTPLSQDVREEIERIFGKLSDRKYQGRNSLYQLEKFLLFKIENVDSKFERGQNSVRYSSYCKGYGESGRSARKQRTRYSYELDRDDTEQLPEEFYSHWKNIHYQEDLFYLEQKLRKERKA
jgi:sRNA-binding regulator protein Hfq